jgi:hypothetical protein
MWGEATYRCRNLKFRCAQCGSRSTDAVMVARQGGLPSWRQSSA